MNYLLELNGRVRIYEILDDHLVELANGYSVGHVINQVVLSDSPNIFILSSDQIPQLTDLVRLDARIYQLSDRFTHHDAVLWSSSKNSESIYFVEGLGSNSEVFTVYAKNKVLLRAFGVNKSPSIFVKNILGVIDLDELMPFAKHPKAIEISTVSAKLASDMYKELITINFLNTEFDMLTSTGATIAYRMHCEKLVKQILRGCGVELVDKQLVCNVLRETIHNLVLLLNTHFGQLTNNIVAIGEIFTLVNDLDINVEKSRHAVFGMLNYLDKLSTNDI